MSNELKSQIEAVARNYKKASKDVVGMTRSVINHHYENDLVSSLLLKHLNEYSDMPRIQKCILNCIYACTRVKFTNELDEDKNPVKGKYRIIPNGEVKIGRTLNNELSHPSEIVNDSYSAEFHNNDELWSINTMYNWGKKISVTKKKTSNKKVTDEYLVEAINKLISDNIIAKPKKDKEEMLHNIATKLGLKIQILEEAA